MSRNWSGSVPGGETFAKEAPPSTVRSTVPPVPLTQATRPLTGARPRNWALVGVGFSCQCSATAAKAAGAATAARARASTSGRFDMAGTLPGGGGLWLVAVELDQLDHRAEPRRRVDVGVAPAVELAALHQREAERLERL